MRFFNTALGVRSVDIDLSDTFSFDRTGVGDLDIEGIKVSLFEAKTLCDFNYFDLSTSEIYNRSNLLMDYSIMVTEKDLKETVKSQAYEKILKKIYNS